MADRGQEAAKRAIRRRGGWVFRAIAQGQAGVPDLAAVYRGRALYVELKAPGDRVSRVQAWTHEQIRAAGGVVVVARSSADVEAALDAIDAEADRGGGYPAGAG